MAEMNQVERDFIRQQIDAMGVMVTAPAPNILPTTVIRAHLWHLNVGGLHGLPYITLENAKFAWVVMCHAVDHEVLSFVKDMHRHLITPRALTAFSCDTCLTVCLYAGFTKTRYELTITKQSIIAGALESGREIQEIPPEMKLERRTLDLD